MWVEEVKNTLFNYFLAKFLSISIGGVHDLTTLRRLHYGRVNPLFHKLLSINIPLLKSKSFPPFLVSLSIHKWKGLGNDSHRVTLGEKCGERVGKNALYEEGWEGLR